METQNTQEKYLIEFREERYNKRLEQFHKYLRDCEKLKQTISNELEIQVDDLNIKGQNLTEIVVSRFSEKYEKQNTLGLSPFKLADLMDIDLQGVCTQITKLNTDNSVFDEPNKEDYCLYIYDPEQIELAKKCEKIKELLIETGMTKIRFNNAIDSPLVNGEYGLMLNPFYFEGDVNQVK